VTGYLALGTSVGYCMMLRSRSTGVNEVTPLPGDTNAVGLGLHVLGQMGLSMRIPSELHGRAICARRQVCGGSWNIAKQQFCV
jgi:hypothetical protein